MAGLGEEMQGNAKLLRGIDKALTALGYVAFIGLVALLLITRDVFVIPCVLVSGISFVLVSAVRKLINAPRPYEVTGVAPIIEKDTSGQSFPSRHAFSMFMIAMCWLRWMPIVGVALLASGVALAVVRVLGGVHFAKDVIAGAVIGICCGILGFWIIF